MALKFKAYISGFGTVRNGTWFRGYPTIINSCNGLEIYQALNAGSYVAIKSSGTIGTVNGKFDHLIDDTKIHLIDDAGNETEIVDYNHLPAGFTVITAKLTVTAHDGSYGTINNVKITCDIDGVSSLSYVPPFANVTYTFDDVPDAFHIFGALVGIDLTANAGASPQEIAQITSPILASGTYQLLSWTSTITSETNPKVFTGETPAPIPVIIESDPEDPDAIDFTQLDSARPVTLLWELENADIMIPAIITMTTYYLEFIIDVYLINLIKAKGKVNVDVMLNAGTQFSGQVKAGTLEILYFDGTGIYKISPSRRNDLIYVDATTTQEFKIPDPVIRLVI